MKIKMLSSILISSIIGCVFCAVLFNSAAHADNKTTAKMTTTTTSATPEGISPQALKYAINGYCWAVEHGQVANPNILTVVDFSKPSFERRLWVIDLKHARILMKLHVAQGRNTGAIYAKRFSNQPGSLESSPGIFTTLDSDYNGEHGVSLRVDGLENGINNNAYERAVVIHAASYVTQSFIKENGYAGRSWGCFAVNPKHVMQFIHTVQGGTVLFAYAEPETHDPRVAHSLTPDGQKLYDAILHRNSGWFL